MPRVISLHDKSQIETIARQNLYMHLYEIGDLDDFFWPSTIWYGWENGDSISQLVLIYTALDVPVFVAHAHPPQSDMIQFLEALKPLLPRKFYTHINPDILSGLTDTYQAESHGLYLKMGLSDPDVINSINADAVQQLSSDDLADLNQLYSESYPGNWFDKRMLETGRYFGVRQNGQLLSVAGIHVYSPAFKVATLGNVTTHPDVRGKGLGKKVCAKLCQALLDDGIQAIGLNVSAENGAAIRVYEGLGFEKMGEYGEFMMTLDV